MQETIIQSIVATTIIFSLLFGSFMYVVIRYFKNQKEKEREIFTAVIKAQEQERQVISSDIHDDLGALLTSARISIEDVLTDYSNPTKKDTIKHVAEVLEMASRSAKNASNALSPTLLNKYGLKGAISDLPNLYKSSTIQFNINYQIKKELDNYIEIIIYRIINEIVNNSVKYANCSVIDISIFEEGPKIRINIDDNGVGFDMLSINENANGIKSIRNRVSFLKGKINITTSQGNGCSYSIIL